MKKLLNINGILDSTYDLYKKYLGSFIGYTALMYMASVAIAYVIIVIFSVVVGAIAAFSITNSGNDFLSGANLAPLLYLFIGILIIIIPATAIIKMIAVGPIHAVYADKRGEKVTFGNMFRYSFKNFWYSFTSSTACYLIYFGVLIIGAILYYEIYTNLLYSSSLFAQIIVGVLISLILIVFFIWFSIKSLFYLQVAICERKHFFSAIVGSFRLTANNFKRIFWIAFSIYLSYFIIYISLGGMLSAISNILSIYMTKPNGTGLAFGIFILQFLMIILQLAVNVALMPIQYLAVPIAYTNERNRLYGDDLHRNINVLLKRQKEELKQN